MTIINRYYSLESFLQECASASHSQKKWSRSFSPDTDTSVSYIRRGATDAQMKPVQELLAKIDATLRSREKREIVPTVAGGMVNVPDFLQGKPLCMRRRTMVESYAAPVRIVVEPLVSGGTRDYTIRARGAAVAALVMRLSETRPVELWAVGAAKPERSETAVSFVKIGVHPISLATLTAVLTTPEFARGCMLTAARKAVGSTSLDIDWGWYIHDSEPRMERIRKELNLEPTDIMVPGGHLTEQDEIIRDPVAWVNKYLDPQREL